MQPHATKPRIIRFGIFEAHLATCELRKRGHRVPLQDQPFQVLVLLIKRPGELVSREELQTALWPDASFGEFDQGLNTAVKKVRQALGDSADNPRFIETVPRKGYRFIAPVAAPESSEPAPPRSRASWPFVASGLTVAVAATAVWWFGVYKWPGITALTPVPLTTYRGQELQPSVAPDGERVAFAWNGEAQDNFDIYVKQIGTERPLRLTTDRAKDFGPAWSPDGRHIAFGRLLEPLKAGIFLMSAIGGPERKLTETTAPHARRPDPFVAWTPDSKWLVVSEASDSRPDGKIPPTGRGRDSLFLYSVETGERKRLTTAPAGAMFDAGAAFSSDGRKLAFVRSLSPSVADLYLLELSKDFVPSETPRRLTSWNQPTSSPVWTAGEREILVAAGPWDRHKLWRVPVSGSESPRRVELAVDHVESLALRGRGRLVYAQQSVDTNIWRAEIAGTGGSFGAAARPFVASTQKDIFPQVSPDGRRILYLSDRTGRWEVWVSDAHDSNPLQLTSMKASIVGGPRWSPDGERIVFDSNQGGVWELYLVDARGGTPKRLTENLADECCASWSHDGRWIYFMSMRSGLRQIWKMPVTGGQAVQVTKNGGHVALQSHDGRYLYYSVSGSEAERDGLSSLRQVSVNGGPETDLLASVTFYNFAVRPDGIYFIPRPDPQGRAAIHFYNFADGKSRLVVLVGEITPGISVSPDGRSIFYSQVDERRSDLVLIDNFQ